MAEDTEVEPVTLIATLQIKEGKRDDAVKYLTALTKAVQKNEPGTLAYVAHTYKNDPNKVLFFEVYAGQEALKKHKPGSYDIGISGKDLFVGDVKVEFLNRFTGYIQGEDLSADQATDGQ